VINVADLVRNVCYLGRACFFEKKTTRLAALCGELQTYICNNQEAIVSYGQRQRESKPIATAGAEGTVNPLVNARL
jgi:hypothetical protein